jgi:hypothetical protein
LLKGEFGVNLAISSGHKADVVNPKLDQGQSVGNGSGGVDLNNHKIKVQGSEFRVSSVKSTLNPELINW